MAKFNNALVLKRVNYDLIGTNVGIPLISAFNRT